MFSFLNFFFISTSDLLQFMESLQQQLWNAVAEDDEETVERILKNLPVKSKEELDQLFVKEMGTDDWGSAYEESIFMATFRMSPVNSSIVKLLLDAGADPNQSIYLGEFCCSGGGSGYSVGFLVFC